MNVFLEPGDSEFQSERWWLKFQQVVLFRKSGDLCRETFQMIVKSLKAREFNPVKPNQKRDSSSDLVISNKPNGYYI